MAWAFPLYLPSFVLSAFALMCSFEGLWLWLPQRVVPAICPKAVCHTNNQTWSFSISLHEMIKVSLRIHFLWHSLNVNIGLAKPLPFSNISPARFLNTKPPFPDQMRLRLEIPHIPSLSFIHICYIFSPCTPLFLASCSFNQCGFNWSTVLI